MKKSEIIDLRFAAAAVPYVERTKSGCILFCDCEDKGYAELVLEQVTSSENEKLTGYHKFLSVKAELTGKTGQNRYVFRYQDTKRTTVFCAGRMELYRYGKWIGEAGRYAAEEWNKRHICLPSLMAAILLLEAGNGGKTAGDIRKLIKERTDYLALWKEEAGREKNWKALWGQENYVLAAQYLQEADRPYFEDKKSEKRLIEIIEKNRLTGFDLWERTGCYVLPSVY